MYGSFRLAGFILALTFALPVLAADDKKDPKADAKEKDYKNKLASGGVLTGTLGHVESDQKYFIVQVDVPYPSPRGYGGAPAGMDPLAFRSLLAEQLQVAMIRNPIQRAIAMRQLALRAHQQRLGGGAGSPSQTQMRKTDIEIKAIDDIKVRIPEPPQEFDDKGKPKKLTARELAKLRGPDKSLPGFTGDFDSLKTGQVVRVYLVKKKEPPKGGGKGKNKDDDDLGEKRLEARMVVILTVPKDK
jgi:hypothetical protein